MKTIPLSRGKEAIVDDDDFDRLSGTRWHFHRYAMRSVCVGGGKWRKAYLHREILGAPDGLQVDHINGDVLDNRKSNLRFATASENCANRKIQKNNKSGATGVSIEKDTGKYRAHIRSQGKSIHLGFFRTLNEASKAYRRASAAFHGEFSAVLREGRLDYGNATH